MKDLSLLKLVNCLDSTSRSALEKATKLSVDYHHDEVTPLHWIYTLISDASDLRQFLEKQGVSIAPLSETLQRHIRQCNKQKEPAIPSFSAELIGLLNDAMQMCLLDFNLRYISSLSILYTFIDNDLNDAALFINIRKNELKEAIYAMNENEAIVESASDDPLKCYASNLTELASQGKLDEVLYRDNEIQNIVDVLSRRRQNNPLLLGEAGVGKTALIEGLALRIVQGNVPDFLKNVQLYNLDLAALQAGAGIQGEFEKRIKSLVHRIQKEKEKIIIFIDEVHNLIGAGGKQGQGDAANLLKPLLARGEMRTIAATTWAEYKKYIENDAALTRRFETIKISEPTAEQAMGILLSIVPKLEKHHHVLIDMDAIAATVKLSMRYLPHRQLPDKAIALLDTACARVQLSQHMIPKAIRELQENIQKLMSIIAHLERQESLGENHEADLFALKNDLVENKLTLCRLESQWQEEKNSFINIDNMRTQMLNSNKNDCGYNLLQQEYQQLLLSHKEKAIENQTVLLQVTKEIVADILSDLTEIPVGKLLSSELATTLSLEDILKERILGQPLAIEILSKKLQTSRMNLQDPCKPQGVFLLVGNSGIGKTETAYVIADLLYGGQESLTVINMSEFKESHKISMLTGSPAGYVGYGEGGILTEALRKRPFGVVLLDEMEKAHPSIQDIFYQVFDKGILFDGQGTAIDCRHTVFLMTSNAGSNSLSVAQENIQDWEMRLQEELLGHFKPAFLARTTVLPYFNLKKNTLTGICQMKLEKIIDRLQEHHQITLSYTKKCLDQLCIASENNIRNAREIDQQLESNILPKLSQRILESLLGQTKHQSSLRLDYHKKNGYVIQF